MKPVTVLHISTERSWRGGEQQLAYLIKGSAALGVKSIVAVRRESAFEKWCDDHGIEYVSLRLINGLDAISASHIISISRSRNVDLVHVHSGKGLSIVYLSLILGLKVPVVVHRRVDFELSSRGISLAKYNHKMVKRIICVSDAIKAMVQKAVQKPERVVTVYSGIDFNRFSRDQRTGYLSEELGIPAGSKIVVNIAAYAPHKDYFTFIDTAAEVLKKYTEVHFLAVGEGAMRDELMKYAAGKGLEKHMTFTGFRNDIPKLLRETDVFLITSKTEGLGTSVIDAMYNCLPVVATRAGGIPELVVHGSTGYLEEPGDAKALAGRVAELLEDESLADQMGEKGHLRSALFSKDAMTENVVALYHEVIDHPDQ